MIVENTSVVSHLVFCLIFIKKVMLGFVKVVFVWDLVNVDLWEREVAPG